MTSSCGGFPAHGWPGRRRAIAGSAIEPPRRRNVLTVPVLNYPTVERHAPVREHEHVLLYDVTPGSLSAVIERGLSDKPHLRQMALDLREHVRKYHLQDAMVDYVIDEDAAC
jgi:hypothetical protein